MVGRADGIERAAVDPFGIDAGTTGGVEDLAKALGVLGLARDQDLSSPTGPKRLGDRAPAAEGERARVGVLGWSIP